MPVRRSNCEPCSQHSMKQPSTSPSDSETAPWEQMSEMACQFPSPSRTTATSTGPFSPSSSTRSASSGATSSVMQASCAVMRVGSPAFDDAHRLGELGLDRLEQALLDRGDADLLDELGEEPADHEATRVGLGDAARLQVEELLVVEATGGRGVPGSLDEARLDLEVRHRVRARAVRQDEVAVELVGVGALGLLADQHVADPHGVRALALQRT